MERENVRDLDEEVRMPDGPPKTFAVLIIEGGVWIPFQDGARSNPKQVHAVMFENGMIWDAHNGWRETKADVDFLRKLWANQ